MAVSMVNHGVWGLVLQSDFVSKIVLFTLFMMSVFSWAVALYKMILLHIKKSQCQKMYEDVLLCKSVSDLHKVVQHYSKTLPGYVLVHVLNSAQQLKDVAGSELLSMYTGQILDEVMHNEESLMPVLSLSSAVATLLGLFGTVWGLIHSFIRISEKQSADIVTVAPGIAEALITTVAGLMVAIPALVFFHHISNVIKDLEYRLMLITDKAEHLIRISMIKPATKEFVESVEKQDQPWGV